MFCKQFSILQNGKTTNLFVRGALLSRRFTCTHLPVCGDCNNGSSEFLTTRRDFKGFQHVCGNKICEYARIVFQSVYNSVTGDLDGNAQRKRSKLFFRWTHSSSEPESDVTAYGLVFRKLKKKLAYLGEERSSGVSILRATFEGPRIFPQNVPPM